MTSGFFFADIDKLILIPAQNTRIKNKISLSRLIVEEVDWFNWEFSVGDREAEESSFESDKKGDFGLASMLLSILGFFLSSTIDEHLLRLVNIIGVGKISDR